MAPPLENVFKHALESLQAGKREDAERRFKKLLQRDPKNFGALNLLGVVLVQRGSYAEAERYIKAAVAINAKNDATLSNYGLVLKALNRPEEALERFSQALAINSAVAETWNNRGTVLNDLKRYDDAIVDFDKAIALQANYPAAFCNKGNSLVEIKRNEEALDAFDKALRCEPRLVEAWLGRGNVLSNLKRYDEAFAAYEIALGLNPGRAESWLARARVFNELRRFDEAFSDWDRALAINPNAVVPWFIKPMNGQVTRRELVRQIITNCRITRVIETGTFLGTTSEYFAKFDIPVVTAESEPEYAHFARRRLKKWKNVDVRICESVQMLRELGREPIDRDVPTLFYLDARWANYFPVREEAESAIENFSKAVLLVDDCAVPDDPGYFSYEYESEKRLDIEYLLGANLPTVAIYFPSTPSHQESGLRSGCVIVTADPVMAEILDKIPLLRRWLL